MLSKNLVFIIASSTMLFYALLVFVLIQETMPKSANKEEDNEKESGVVWKIVLRDKALMIYLLAGIIISMGFSQTEGMLPLHFDNEMKDIFGTNNPYPYLMALNGLLVVLFQFQISKWATDKPVGKTMLYGACLFGIGLFYRLVTEVVWRIRYKCYNYFNNVTVCVCHIYIRRDDYVACTDDVCSEFGP